MPRLITGHSFLKHIVMSDLESQKQFYDEYWRGMKPLSSYKLQRVEYITGKLNDIRKATKDDIKLLDLGCGDGRLVPLWQSITAGEAHGLELSPEAVKTAQSMFSTVTYKQGNATETPYADNEFDVIVCQEVIEHVEEQQKLINECSRLLKKNGWLIITTPNRYYFDRRKGGNYSKQPIEKLLNKNELLTLLRNSFNLADYDTVIYAQGDFGAYRVLTNRYLLGALRRTGYLPKWKQLLLSKGLGLHMIATCRKK